LVRSQNKRRTTCYEDDISIRINQKKRQNRIQNNTCGDKELEYEERREIMLDPCWCCPICEQQQEMEVRKEIVKIGGYRVLAIFTQCPNCKVITKPLLTRPKEG